MLSVYVAGPWAHKSFAAAVAKTVQAAGYIVVSTWHDEELEDEDLSVGDMAARAFLDLEELSQAGVMFLLNLEKSEGKAVEQGFAIKSGMPIIAVGLEENNIFQNLPMYTFVETTEEGIHELDMLDLHRCMVQGEIIPPPAHCCPAL